MIFSHLLGNPAAKELLTKLVEKAQLPSTLLFSGPKGVGKMLFARALAAKLLGSTKSHPPDLHLYAPTGKSMLHTMEAMRELIDEAAMAPFEAPVKIFILDEAERMLPSSSNALLKTLEEPPLGAFFILISSEPEQLLPTLVSRCSKVAFFPVANQEITPFIERRFTLSGPEAERVAFLAQGSVSKACMLAEKGESQIPGLVEELFAKRNLAVLKDLEELVSEEGESNLLEEIELFFRECHRKNPTDKKLPTLSRLMPLLEECRLAFERHVKPTTALQALFLKLWA